MGLLDSMTPSLDYVNVLLRYHWLFTRRKSDHDCRRSAGRSQQVSGRFAKDQSLNFQRVFSSRIQTHQEPLRRHLYVIHIMNSGEEPNPQDRPVPVDDIVAAGHQLISTASLQASVIQHQPLPPYQAPSFQNVATIFHQGMPTPMLQPLVSTPIQWWSNHANFQNGLIPGSAPPAQPETYPPSAPTLQPQQPGTASREISPFTLPPPSQHLPPTPPPSRRTTKSPLPKPQQPPKPTRKKRHICHICGQACYRPSNLKTHLLTHTGERPFPCGGCSATFTTSSNRRRHERRFHPEIV
jgi:hypothetical protein